MFILVSLETSVLEAAIDFNTIIRFCCWRTSSIPQLIPLFLANKVAILCTHPWGEESVTTTGLPLPFPLSFFSFFLFAGRTKEPIVSVVCFTCFLRCHHVLSCLKLESEKVSKILYCQRKKISELENIHRGPQCSLEKKTVFFMCYHYSLKFSFFFPIWKSSFFTDHFHKLTKLLKINGDQYKQQFFLTFQHFFICKK